MTARENDFDVTDIRHLRAVAMLYQTGSLTVKDYRSERYLLGIPDEEVRRDLVLLVAAQSAERDETWVGQTRRSTTCSTAISKGSSTGSGGEGMFDAVI